MRVFLIARSVSLGLLGLLAGPVFAGGVGGSAGNVTLHAFEDFNGNGVRENNDKGLPGWTFVVTPVGPAAGGQRVLTTGANGFVTDTLPPGAYQVKLQNATPAGWTATATGGMSSKALNVPNAGGMIALFFGFQQASSVPGPSAGAQPGKLLVTVFEDQDGNGAMGPGEAALGGWWVKMERLGPNPPPPATAMTPTSAGGKGMVATQSVAPGTYKVYVTVKAGYTATTPNASKIAQVAANQAVPVVLGVRKTGP